MKKTDIPMLADYSQYFDLDCYLFDVVSRRYRQFKTLSVFDFFCIVIWKANRAKSNVAKRLLKRGHASLEKSVEALFHNLADCDSSRSRFECLIYGWGFRLPMVSALLSVLYPEDFTVYDIRVCDQINDFHKLANISAKNKLWNGYCEFKQRVSEFNAEGLSLTTLRDKDRYLWGKSFYEQLRNDIDKKFEDLKDRKVIDKFEKREERGKVSFFSADEILTASRKKKNRGKTPQNLK